MMENVPSVDELSGLIIETVRRNGFTEDAYIRPSFYKSTRAIGVRLHHLENELYIVVAPVRQLHRHRFGLPGDDLVVAAERR